MSSALMLLLIVTSLTESITSESVSCTNLTVTGPDHQFQYPGISMESLNATKSLDLLLNLPPNEININLTSTFFKQLEPMLPANLSLNQSYNVTHLRDQLLQFLPSQLKEEFQEILPIETDYGVLYKVMNKSLITIKYLIQKGANVYQSLGYYEDKYPIQLVQMGRLDIIKYLIEDYKIDLKEVSSSIKSLSLIAARSGHLNLMQYLVEKSGLNFNDTKDYYGDTLLHKAAWGGQMDIVKYLVSCQNVDVNAINSDKQSPVMYATKNGHLNIIQYLINNNANFNNTMDKKNNTLIHFASQSGNLEELKYILNITGVQNYSKILNIKNSDNNRPLNFAASNGNIDVVKFLVENGAKVNIRGRSKDTALHDACESGNFDVVIYLTSVANANVSARNQNFATPLHLAVTFGSLEIVKYLIENTTSNINAANLFKGTPLHFAVFYERFEIAKYLVYAGADYNLKDTYGKTPLQQANRDYHKNIADMLREYIKTRE